MIIVQIEKYLADRPFITWNQIFDTYYVFLSSGPYFENESTANQNKALVQKSDNGEAFDNSRRCSIFKLGELLSDIESFNESRTIIKGERDLYESFLMPRKSNTDSLNQFRMVLDEKFGDQVRNIDLDRNVADEKNHGKFPD